MRLLLVDNDGSLTRTSMRRTLCSGGIQVLEAGASQAALDIATAGVVDLVAPHLRFQEPPDPTAGLTLAKRLRAGRPNVAVAIWSGCDKELLTYLVQPVGAEPVPLPMAAALLRATLRRKAGFGPTPQLRLLLDMAKSDDGFIARVRVAREALRTGMIAVCADELGLRYETLRRHGLIGLRWSDAELRSMVVEGRTMDGRKISGTHLREIAAVECTKRRRDYVEMCFQGLSVDALRDRIRADDRTAAPHDGPLSESHKDVS